MDDTQPIGDRFHVGLCPFHDEIEPSFVVDSRFGGYHCFGCVATGNGFDWAWEYRPPPSHGPEGVE